MPRLRFALAVASCPLVLVASGVPFNDQVCLLQSSAQTLKRNVVPETKLIIADPDETAVEEALKSVDFKGNASRRWDTGAGILTIPWSANRFNPRDVAEYDSKEIAKDKDRKDSNKKTGGIFVIPWDAGSWADGRDVSKRKNPIFKIPWHIGDPSWDKRKKKDPIWGKRKKKMSDLSTDVTMKTSALPTKEQYRDALLAEAANAPAKPPPGLSGKWGQVFTPWNVSDVSMNIDTLPKRDQYRNGYTAVAPKK